MLRERTVFVLGAGASAPYGFPLGRKLIDDTIHLFDASFGPFNKCENDQAYFWKAVLDKKTLGLEADHFNKCAEYISKYLRAANSIDEFINRNIHRPEIEKLLKIALVHLILKAERTSCLWYDEGEKNSHFENKLPENNWYQTLWHAISTSQGALNARNLFESITFITFNYDRSLEHYLYHRVLGFTLGDELETKQIMNGLRIYHVYGSVGDLSYINSDSVMEYGAKNYLPHSNIPNDNKLEMLTNKIFTIKDTFDDQNSKAKIHRAMENAQQLYFIGMAYHEKNLELILPENYLNSSYVKGTGFKIKKSMRYAISDAIYKRINNPHADLDNTNLIDDLEAHEFIEEIGYPLIKYNITPMRKNI